ncbi:FIST signal transduction protein [Nodosilinea sp. E11]|uniref:FIST signal transduction protein n=1 Tax=Nodosilinea sp. E11 TaxID=3037479 RepID=UPI002934ADAD|nr:FIST N-terminal domain-containing protein [Nodosilinea sp. E11]WOD41524.1 FIST N-terminal domain-containing protein [Nodosilinea sp. E11]
MLKVAVGHSHDPDSLEAINEVLAQCSADLGEYQPQAGLLFAALEFDHKLILRQIDQRFPGLELIGGTTDGELSSVLQFQQDSLTLMLFSSDDIEMCAGVGRQISADPVAIAHQAVIDAQHHLTQPVQLCIALPESLTTSTVAILQGLESALGAVPIFGGATADQWQYRQTYQFYKTEVLSDAVPFLLWAGNLVFSHGVAGGWHPIGKPSQVTKVDRNVIYEIDHQPALTFYHYYLNDSEPDAIYPLAVFPPGETRYFLRGAVGYDAGSGSITVSGDVPENSTVQITDASLDDVVAASQTAFVDALSHYPGGQPDAALFFSCAWRRQILGTRAPEEYQAIHQSLKPAISSCGFYTYGEIAPFQHQGKTFFHNTTFVALLLGSRS